MKAKEMLFEVKPAPDRHTSRTISFHCPEAVAKSLAEQAAVLNITVSRLVYLVCKSYCEQMAAAEARRPKRKRKPKGSKKGA